MDLTTQGYKLLRSLFRDMESGDAWGDAMAFFFALADVMWHGTAIEIPPEWQYRHGEICDGDHEDDYALWQLKWASSQVTDDDLVAFGTVLHRYTNLLRLAGEDY